MSSSDRELVRSVTRQVVARLGNAGPEVVEAVVAEVLSNLGSARPHAAPQASIESSASAASHGRSPVTTPRGATFLPTVGAGSQGPSLDVCVSCVEQEKSRKRSRAILTTTGRNTRGIVARVTSRVADLGGDILDISQTLVGDYFTMILVIDVASLTVSFERFRDDTLAAVKETGCHAMMMHEDVMNALHRV